MAEKNNDGVSVDNTTDNYNGWTWKEIKVAIIGSVDAGATVENSTLAVTSDYNTLVTAGQYFADAQNALQKVQSGFEALQKSVERTWKGKGADGFRTMLKTFKGTL